MQTTKPKLVISTGAGMSAESGISTFRDAGGLWENHNVMDVASADGFARNPELVHRFYNERRRDLLKAQPNKGHLELKELEKYYDVYIITQNVDDLHERAGSSRVLHLHGELMKVRTIEEPTQVYTLDEEHLETTPDSTDAQGRHLRPHIVFFQEAVPNIERAGGVDGRSRRIRGYRHIACRISRGITAALCACRSTGLLHRPQSGSGRLKCHSHTQGRVRGHSRAGGDTRQKFAELRNGCNFVASFNRKRNVNIQRNIQTESNYPPPW